MTSACADGTVMERIYYVIHLSSRPRRAQQSVKVCPIAYTKLSEGNDLSLRPMDELLRHCLRELAFDGGLGL